MKVFLDTNVFVEYIFEREQFPSVQRIFQAITEKQIEGITSHATFYTLAYLSEQMLKHKGIHRPELTERTRMIIRSMLQLVRVGNLEHEDMIAGVDDASFSDIENSFQHQCALRNQWNQRVLRSMDRGILPAVVFHGTSPEQNNRIWPYDY